VRLSARGATLVVGLILLSLVTLLGLAGASTAHVEARLAQNERFRENAASAASAGIEYAIRRIVNISDSTVPPTLNATLPGSSDRFETTTRLAGFEVSLPQDAGARLVGAHFEISSTGFSARRSVDRQRATVMLIVESPNALPLPCEPPRVRCFRAGEIVRTGWQRTPGE
jgi:type II secretory pathway component PulK